LKSALNDPEIATPKTLPALLLKIAPQADLLVEYKENERPIFTLHAATLEREDQARLAAEVERETKENEADIATLPVFTLFTSIKEWLVSNPLHTTTTSTEVREERRPPPPSSSD
jgi:hypothetical protein